MRSALATVLVLCAAATAAPQWDRNYYGNLGSFDLLDLVRHEDDPMAMRELGRRYLNATGGLEEDVGLAIIWMRRWAETGDAYGMWILAIVLWDQVAWEHGEHFVYEDLAEQKKRIVLEAYAWLNLASQCLPGWRKFADLATERFGERRSLQRAMAHVLDISYGVEVDCSAIPEEAKRVS